MRAEQGLENEKRLGLPAWIILNSVLVHVALKWSGFRQSIL